MGRFAPHANLSKFLWWSTSGLSFLFCGVQGFHSCMEATPPPRVTHQNLLDKALAPLVRDVPENIAPITWYGRIAIRPYKFTGLVRHLPASLL
jgi:hypothetical protein